MYRHIFAANLRRAWSTITVLFAVTIITLVAVALAAPVEAAQKCKDHGKPSFSCPTSATQDVCGNSPNFYCMSDGGNPNADVCSGSTPAPNYIFNCQQCKCVCDTANYPCNGCNPTSVTPGGTCGSPVNGQYTNGCPESCACPSGTTRCAATNTCVTNMSCPVGMTFDPCVPGCVTPYILRSPATTQLDAFIKIEGNIQSTAGDLFLGSGKAIRVDGAGATTLAIGNWGGGSLSTKVNGRLGVGSLVDPGYRLDVPSNGDTTDILNLNDTDGNVATRVWTGSRLAREAVEKWYIGMNDVTDDLLMQRNGGGAGNTSVFISNSTGNVGIGTTNPTSTLSVGAGGTTNFGVDGTTGNVTTAGDLAVNGGDITTTAPIGNVFNSSTGVVNVGGAASSLNLGTGATNVTIGGGSSSTGCSLDALGNLLCSGTISSGGGSVGYWDRATGTITPVTSTDALNVPGNVVAGSLQVTGNATIGGGEMTSLTLDTANLDIPGGLLNIGGAAGLVISTSAGHTHVGVGSNLPGYAITAQSNGDTTAIISVNDNDNNLATRVWTGNRLAREFNEKWFIGMNNTSDDLLIQRNGTAGSNSLFVSNSTGYVGINNSNPQQSLDVGGNVAVGGTTVINSSRALQNLTGISLAGDYVQTSGNFTFSGPGTFSTGAANTTLGNTTVAAGKSFTFGTAAADPVGSNGMMYYSTAINAFRCFQSGAWTNCYSDNAAIGTGAPGQAVFWTGTNAIAGDNAFFWDNANKRLGIGTVSPAYPLDVRNGSALGTAEMRLNNDNTTKLTTGVSYARLSTEKWFTGMTSANDNFTVRRNGATDDLVVDGSGRVGLGTSAPAYRLDIGPNGDTQDIVRLNDVDGNVATRLWTGTTLARESTEKWFAGMNATDDLYRIRANGSTDMMVFDPSTGPMVNGNLGVGVPAMAAVGANVRGSYTAGVWGEAVTYGVYGKATSTTGTPIGVFGTAANGGGVYGSGTTYGGKFTEIDTGAEGFVGYNGYGFYTTNKVYFGGGIEMGAAPLSLGSLATAPATPVNGQMYYDSALNTFRCYQGGAWTNCIGGNSTGTQNYVAKWTSATQLGNSSIFDNGTSVGIGTASPGAEHLTVKGTGTQILAWDTNATFTGSSALYVKSDANHAISAEANGAGNPVAIYATSNNGIGLNAMTTSGKALQGISYGAGTGGYFQSTSGIGVDVFSGNLVVRSGKVGIGNANPTANLDVTGTVNVAASAGLGGSALNVSNNGGGYAAYVSTNSPLNGIAALRAYNNGQGPAIEANGGTNGTAVLARAGGDNVALDAAVYDHSSPNTLATVLQVRRGTSGTPANGMGSEIQFVMETVGGSHYGAGYVGSVWTDIASQRNALVFGTSSGGSDAERMRLTYDGKVGINTTAPGARLDVIGSGSEIAVRGVGSSGWGGFFESSAAYGLYALSRNASYYGLYAANNAGGTAAYVTSNGSGTGLEASSSSGTGVSGSSNSGMGGYFSNNSSTVPALKVESGNNSLYAGNNDSWFKFWTGGNSRMSMGDGYGYEAGFIAGGQNDYSQNTIILAACDDLKNCPRYMVLNQSGNVGIGTETPSYPLDVSGDIRATGSVYGSCGNVGGVSLCSNNVNTGGYVLGSTVYGDTVAVASRLRLQGQNAWGITPYSSADWIIGMPAGGEWDFSILDGNGNWSSDLIRIFGDGNVWMKGALTQNSDARLKRNIQPITGALDQIKRLKGVNFVWANPDEHGEKYGRQGGFIAQDVRKVFPSWVTEGDRVGGQDASLIPDGKVLNLDITQELNALLVEAVKQLDKTTLKLDPDGGVVIGGDLQADGNVWGADSGWLSCPESGECSCPQGSYMTSIKDRGAWIKCHKL